jgi:hypothetical protein
MFWKHSKKDTKLLLNATLLLFAAYAFSYGHAWKEGNIEMLPANTVGVFAGVERNEVNTIVANLDAREKDIVAREQALVYAQASDTRMFIVTVTMGAGLLGLILFNFYLDFHRRKNIAEQ